MDGGDAIDEDRKNERGQVSRKVPEQCAEESALSGMSDESEEDWGREKNGGMDIDVICFVLAEDLVRYLYVFRGDSFISSEAT